MNLNELLAELFDRGVKLWADGDQLRIRAPKGVLTPELRDSLGEQKAELLLLLGQSKMGASATDLPLVPISRKRNLPLSFQQESMWVMAQFAPGSTPLNITQAFRLTGQLNIAALQQSLNEIVRRHEALRTTFATVEGKPVQSFSHYGISLQVVDFQDLDEADHEDTIKQIADEEAQQPFDLTQGPLLSFKLMRLGESDHVLFLVFHHLISDVFSLGLFIRELTGLYEAFCIGKPSPLPEISIQYGDFAVWQQQWLQSEVLENNLTYWKKQLDGAPSVLELPTDHPRPLVRSFRGAHQLLKLSPSLWSALKQLSYKQGLTPFMTLLAAFKVLLYKYSGQEDITVGSPTSGRVHPQIESIIGSFAYPLVLRTNMCGNPSFQELLGRVREVILGAYAHQNVPLGKLVQVTQPLRSMQYNPLFQVLFGFLGKQLSTIKIPGLALTHIAEASRATTDMDLFLNMYEVDEELHGLLEYNTDLFNTSTMIRMVGHFQTLLEGIVANPAQQLSALPLLTAAERQQLLVMSNGSLLDFDRGNEEPVWTQLDELSDEEVNVLLNEMLSEGRIEK